MATEEINLQKIIMNLQGINLFIVEDTKEQF
jgi:hypothetical protein